MPVGTSTWLQSAMKDETLRSLEPTFVCLIDILGYKSYLETRTLFEAAKEQAGIITFCKEVASGELFRQGKTEDGRILTFPPRNCRVLRFSDTFLIYSLKGPIEALIDIAQTACTLMGTLVAFGIPVRGALTRGDLYVSDDNTQIVGAGLVRAFHLEQEQDWLGAIVDSDVIGASKDEREFLDLMVHRGELHRYDVPTKVTEADGTKLTKSIPRLCLGWPMSITRVGSESLRERIHKRAPPRNENDVKKIEAGLSFYDVYVRDSECAADQRDLWNRMRAAVAASDLAPKR